MVKAHPNYRTPTDADIQEAIEFCGYEYYLPRQIFLDLVALYSRHMMGENIKDYLKDKLDDKPIVKEFYTTLSYDYFMGSTPLSKALFTLKELSKEVNFRSLEKGRDPSKLDGNYIKEPDETSSLIMSESETELEHEEQARLMKFIMDFKGSLPMKIDNSSTSILKAKMKVYKDMFRVDKSYLVRPDFNFKLVNKRLIVDKEFDKDEDDDILIYLEDASSSMSYGDNFVASKAIQKLICDDPRTVHYYRFSNKIELYELKSFEEKIKVFSQEKQYYKTQCDYIALIKMLNDKYSKGDVIISTDGEDVIPSTLNSPLTLYAVTHSRNNNLSMVCRRTGGKYLVI